MNFPNRFKIWWWIILMVFLTWISAWRFGVGMFNNFDIFIFTSWFILALFPIVSEISIGGISVKKEINEVRKEIREQIGEIKNEIRNHINVNPIINVNTVPANQPEYQRKVEEEVQEEETQDKDESSAITEKDEEMRGKKSSALDKIHERFKKAISAEKLVSEYLSLKYGEKFKSQIKIKSRTEDKELIVDGVLFEEEGVAEIVETRLITSKSFKHMFYVLSNFIKKATRLRINIPIKFIIVSEEMNSESAQEIKEEVIKLNRIRKFNSLMPRISAQFFKLDDNKLIEISSHII